MARIMATPTIAAMRTTDRRAASLARAERSLAGNRLQSPAVVASSARNARAELDRHARWRPAREALWQLIDPYLEGGARVAVVGAGNGDDLPLERIATRAGEAVLIDLDPHAARRARRRLPRGLRSRIEIAEHDVTSGAADAIALAAAEGRVPDPPLVAEGPLPGSPYDLVIGDLLYTQLLYPALLDLGVPDRRRQAFLEHYGPTLTRSVVARLHVSAPYRQVVHIHDPLAWWPGHDQPVALAEILAAAEDDPTAALALAARGAGPRESDPRAALRAFDIPIQATALWRWPFSPGVDYLACATLAGAPSGRSSVRSSRR